MVRSGDAAATGIPFRFLKEHMSAHVFHMVHTNGSGYFMYLTLLICVSINDGNASPTRTQYDTARVIQLLDSAYELEGTNADAALRVYDEVIVISKSINYIRGVAKATHYSGIVYSDKSEYDKALKRYRMAMQLYRSIHYSRGVGACYTNIGNLYRFRGVLDSALVNYQSALKIFQHYRHSDALSQAYGNVGGMFQEMRQFKKALDYHTQSIAAAIESHDSSILSRALINQGTVLNDLKQPEESAAAHQSALIIADAIGDTYSLVLANINLADHYKQQKDYNKAIAYGESALKYVLQLETPFDVADVKRALGDVYAAAEMYSKAQALYLDAITVAKDINATGILAATYRSMHRASASTGDYERAYHFQQLAQRYDSTRLNEKQLSIINELEVKFQSLQKDESIARQKLELEKSKQYVLYSIGAAVILSLSILLFYLYYNNKRREHRRLLNETARENEFKVLQALMQGEEKERVRIASGLHDEVGGILAAAKMHLSALGPLHDVAASPPYHNATKLLDEASSSVRKTAHNLMPELLLTHGLDFALRRYCDNISNDRGLAIQYDSWGEIERFSSNIELSVYRIVQELLNNMIKHSQATEGLVQLSVQEGMLSITVEDNGIGFTPTDAHAGMGIASLRTRVQALNGKMDVTTASGAGVSVFLEFPIASNRVAAVNKSSFD